MVLAAVAFGQSDDAATVCTAYNEAPGLAARVVAGELPPVAERLPLHPRVVAPAHEIGAYGGTLHDLYDGSRLAEFRQYGYENLVRWTPDGSEVIPNIAESFTVSDDGTSFTFRLREGLKWSDGHPFTSADILYWWERVETNPEINPGGPYRIFVVDGEPATVTADGDYSVTFSWSKPNGLFLENLAGPYGVRVTQFPKHYIEQFDPQVNPEGVARMMAEAGQTSYGQWWISRVGTYGQAAEYNDPARPSLQPWIPTAPYVGETQFTFVRNPYYFKVDTACNQLPYIDARTFTLATDPELRLLKTIAGEDDFSNDDISQPTNRAVFFENLSDDTYHFQEVLNSNFNTFLLHLELNKPDEAQAAVLDSKDFRIGLSLAMDRQAVIDTVFVGQGVPYQQAPRPDSPFYNEQLATQYTEHDVELANEYLDRIMPERGPDGMRLRPDGQPFTFQVMVNAEARPYFVDIVQLLERDWEQVGIDTVIVSVSNDAFFTRRQDPSIDAYAWIGENGSGLLPILGVAFDAFTPEAAWGWIAWRTLQQNPAATVTAEPIEPPAEVKRQYELMTEIQGAVDPAERERLMGEFLQISADTFYTIGLSLPAGDYYAVSNRLKNVPDRVISGWLYPGPAPANFETFYIAPAGD
ncbi:MAG TPA: ABC transporter substrate-binding protein [Trueperaceae bacterium]